MNVGLVTALLFSSMIVMLLTGLPVAFCMGGLAVLFGWLLWGMDTLVTVPMTIYNNIDTIVLIALPLFIFMGMMLERSGIAEDLYKMMFLWIGAIPGGLAIGTVLICTIFAAMTGITGAATVSMGLIALPSMLKRGYNAQLSMGCIMAGGALGPLIPPSVIMILYGFLTQESVGRLFAGGILPGLLLSFLFIVYILIRCKINPSLGPVISLEETVTLKYKLSSIRAIILPILLIIAVLGAIFSGIATPTEAAAVGAIGSILCAFMHRTLSRKALKEACYRTINLTGMVMWIVIGATAFTTVYIGMGAPKLIEDIVMSIDIEPLVVMIVIQLSFFLLGMILDPTGIMMICAPVYVPIIRALGFDAVWFGVLFVINMEMAYLTPPYGFNLFYMKGVAPEGITMTDIYKSVWPFVALQGLGLVLCMLIPEIILLIPNLLLGVE